MAMQAYARQARDTDMERWVAEIRLRARRRVGELSAALPTAQGLRSSDGPKSKSDAIQEAGLSLAEAKRCEQIAKVPEAQFEAYVAGRSASGQPVVADDVGRLRAKTPAAGGGEWS